VRMAPALNMAYRVEVRTGQHGTWRPVGYRDTYAAATDLADVSWGGARGQLSGIRVIDQYRENVGAEPIVYSIERVVGAQA